MIKKKVTLVKLNEKTGKRAANARRVATPESISKTESIRKDKLKRMKEFRSWWN